MSVGEGMKTEENLKILRIHRSSKWYLGRDR